MSGRSLPSRLWYRFLQRFLQVVAVLVCRVRFTGQENVPAEGGVLVVSNHQSHFDPPLVGVCCKRRLNYMARESLFDFAPFRWLIQSADAIPIDRDGFGLAGMRETLRRLKRGEMVLMFPEGTRSSDGEIAPFRPGFAALASRSGAAIQPVAVEGAFQAWPRWRRFPRLGTIHLHFGPPMLPEEIRNYDERQLLVEVERRVRECQAVVRSHPVFSRRR